MQGVSFGDRKCQGGPVTGRVGVLSEPALPLFGAVVRWELVPIQTRTAQCRLQQVTGSSLGKLGRTKAELWI